VTQLAQFHKFLKLVLADEASGTEGAQHCSAASYGMAVWKPQSDVLLDE
jgi:hypothetical protein